MQQTWSYLSGVQAEFEDICEESQLWNKLHTLEQLCQEQGLFGEHQDAAGYDLLTQLQF